MLKRSKINFIVIIFIYAFSSINLFAQELYNLSAFHPFYRNLIHKFHPELESEVYITPFSYNIKTVEDKIPVQMFWDARFELPKAFQSNFTKCGNTYVGRLNVGQLLALSKYEGLIYVNVPNIYSTQDDLARMHVGANLLHNSALNNTSFKGDNVIVGIIDSGVDYFHPDFSFNGDSTKTRILSIWDQTLNPIGGEVNPTQNGVACVTCNFGVEYSKVQIENEIDGSPAGFLRTQDTQGHGTHVLSTAAGNGTALTPNRYIGMAPKADILVVKTSFYDTDIVEALNYLKAKAIALNKPLVVNMSLGSQFTPHDGTSVLDQAVNAFTGNKRIVVCAAGNDGNTNIHNQFTVNDADSTNTIITVPSYSPNPGTNNDYFSYSLWSQNADPLTIKLTSPAGQQYIYNQTGEFTISTNEGDVTFFNNIYSNNGKRYMYVLVSDITSNTPAIGNWVITVINPLGGAANVTYHGWLYLRDVGANKALLVNGNSNYTIVSPASADSAIAVGAYIHRYRWADINNNANGYGGNDQIDTIAAFSSLGPLVNGISKPDISAPGMGTIGALSRNYNNVASTRIVAGSRHYVTQGTSMAAPVITGAIALLLQREARYGMTYIKNLLVNNAITDAKTGITPNNQWGYGKANVFRAMAKLLKPNNSTYYQQLSYDNIAQRTAVTVNNGTYHAVRFTPTSNGYLTGIIFHTSATVPTLNNPITLSLYTDNASNPGTLIKAYTFTSSRYLINNNNTFEIPTLDLPVVAGTSFHVVLRLPSGSSIGMFRDNTNLGRYKTSTNLSSWTTQAGTLRVRVFYNTDPADFLPVTFLSVNGQAKKNHNLIAWKTAQEINNAGFSVQKKVSNAFEDILWVEAKGNSSGIHYYEVEDTSISNQTTFYRIKQVDLNGDYAFSNTVAVYRNQDSNLSYQLINGQIQFNIVLDKIMIYDLAGKLLLQQENDVENINIQNLSKGIYLAVGYKNNQPYTFKIRLTE